MSYQSDHTESPTDYMDLTPETGWYTYTDNRGLRRSVPCSSVAAARERERVRRMVTKAKPRKCVGFFVGLANAVTAMLMTVAVIGIAWYFVRGIWLLAHPR